MRHLKIYIAAFVVLLISACASNRYHTTRIQNLDFSQYKTYGWLPAVDSLSKDYFSNDIAKSNIMNTSNDELSARGLSYTKENPDLLFRYIAIVNNKSRLVYGSNFNMGWGGPWGWYNPWHFGWGFNSFYGGSYPVGKEKIRYGHIILEAVDRKTKSVVWQARGSSEVEVPEKAINGLPKLVSGIMKEFPVAAKKK